MTLRQQRGTLSSFDAVGCVCRLGEAICCSEGRWMERLATCCQRLVRRDCSFLHDKPNSLVSPMPQRKSPRMSTFHFHKRAFTPGKCILWPTLPRHWRIPHSRTDGADVDRMCSRGTSPDAALLIEHRTKPILVNPLRDTLSRLHGRQRRSCTASSDQHSSLAVLCHYARRKHAVETIPLCLSET